MCFLIYDQKVSVTHLVKYVISQFLNVNNPSSGNQVLSMIFCKFNYRKLLPIIALPICLWTLSLFSLFWWWFMMISLNLPLFRSWAVFWNLQFHVCIEKKDVIFSRGFHFYSNGNFYMEYNHYKILANWNAHMRTRIKANKNRVLVIVNAKTFRYNYVEIKWNKHKWKKIHAIQL